MIFNMSKTEMIDQLHEFKMERMRMDRFFSMFLDKCGGKMDPKKTETPVWKLYKAKMKEYGDLQRSITTLEYRIKVATK